MTKTIATTTIGRLCIETAVTQDPGKPEIFQTGISNQDGETVWLSPEVADLWAGLSGHSSGLRVAVSMTMNNPLHTPEDALGLG